MLKKVASFQAKCDDCGEEQEIPKSAKNYKDAMSNLEQMGWHVKPGTDKNMAILQCSKCRIEDCFKEKKLPRHIVEELYNMMDREDSLQTILEFIEWIKTTKPRVATVCFDNVNDIILYDETDSISEITKRITSFLNNPPKIPVSINAITVYTLEFDSEKKRYDISSAYLFKNHGILAVSGLINFDDEEDDH